MGQKVHPKGFRLGIIENWDSRWFARREYAELLHEDIKIRNFLKKRLYHAGVSKIEIERAANKAKINIHTARPGIVIGKKGAEIEKLKRECSQGRNPRDAKVELAQEIVARFHSERAAQDALAQFTARFKEGAIPDEMPELTVHAAGDGIPIAQLAKQAGVVESTSEALRLIQQRGLRIDGDVVADKSLTIPPGRTVVVQAGKRRFARVTVQ